MNPTRASSLTLLRRLRSAALAGGSLVLVSPLAAQLFWDGANASDSTYNGGGAGTWNTSALNWGAADLTANTAWSSGSAAIFAGTGGAVAVGEALTASALTFNAEGYTLSSSPTANLLTLTGARTVTTASGVTATLGASLFTAGTGQLTKEGAGTLILNAQTTTAGWTINSGTIVAGSATSFGASGANRSVALNGATIDIRRDGGSQGYSFALTVTGNSTILNSRTTAGTGQTNGATGGLSIGTATLNLAAGQNVNNNTAHTWRFGDGVGTDTISLTGNATFNVANNGTGTGTLSFNTNAPLNDGGTARTITKQGTGTLLANATATSLVDGTVVTIEGGVFAARAAGALGSSAAVNVSSGAQFQFGSTTGAGVANTIKALSGAGTVLSANGSGSTGTNALTISSAITPGGASVGTLTFDTANTGGAATVGFGSGATLAVDLAAAGSADKLRFFNYAAGELLLSGNVINFNNTIGAAAAGQTYTLFEFFSDGVGASAVASGLGSGLTIGSGLEAFTGSTLNFDTTTITLTVGSLAAVPEPGAFALLAGAVGLGFAAVRRRRRAAV